MSSYCWSDLLLVTPSDLLWSVVLSSKLLLTTQSLYMWFYTGHTFLALWMGATVLDAPFSQLLCIERCCYDQRMWESAVFEALRVLSVLLITVFTCMPVAQSKLSPPCCWYFFSNWILAFTDTRVEPPPAIAPPPQWAAPSCMVYVNPRSPFCDLHCRVRHQKHLERP